MLSARAGKRKGRTWLHEAPGLRGPASPAATANCFLAGLSCFLFKSGPAALRRGNGFASEQLTAFFRLVGIFRCLSFYTFCASVHGQQGSPRRCRSRVGGVSLIPRAFLSPPRPPLGHPTSTASPSGKVCLSHTLAS